jgi:hypothetical protein
MAIPFYIHSAMTGAPQFSSGARTVADVLAAVLVNGFNVQAPSSAAASGGVLTLNYPSAHGYEALAHIELSGASVSGANGVWRVAGVPAGNQLTVAIPGLADGSVGGTMSTKVAPAGWTEPFTANSTTRVFRMGSGNQRYLRIVQSAAATAAARAYEAMTALSTGTGPFPTAAQEAGNGTLFGSPNPIDSAVGWWALAGPDFFYLQKIYTVDTGWGSCFFGDISEPVKAADAYHTVLYGSLQYSSAYIARSHTGISGALTANPVQATPTLTQPSPIVSGQRFLFGIPMAADGALRGLLPGAFAAYPPASSGDAGAVLSSVTGISGRVRHLHGYSNTGKIALALDEAWT